ncbi:MAG: hypothetical protein KAT15_12820, partial [Bacteroidales bacterium]|nr:hypothetical protein [Bacteroidales bacterium]
MHIFRPGVEVVAEVPPHLPGVVELQVWISAHHFIQGKTGRPVGKAVDLFLGSRLIHPHIGQCKCFPFHQVPCIPDDGIPFYLRFCLIDGLLQRDVRIQRVVFGIHNGLGIAGKHRDVHAALQYDLSTNLQMGKFFKQESGVNIPVFASYSKAIVNPE